MLKGLISLILIFIPLSLFGCGEEQPAELEHTAFDITKSEQTTENASVSAMCALPPGEDMGQEYIDSFIFLGESTTSHLKSRGVLSGGTQTKQVWTTKSGTLMLDMSTADCRIIYPETNEELDLAIAMEQKRPKLMLLTFGLNGAAKNVERGEQHFKGCYKKLIDTLLAASPDTCILIQACFPVAAHMDMSRHSVDARTLNGYIDTLNKWAMELASDEELGFLNTAEILKDSEGFLIDTYAVEDGYHLTQKAYLQILNYIRTHPYIPKEA